MVRFVGRILTGFLILTLMLGQVSGVVLASPRADAHGQDYVVQRGDSLYTISESLLGDGSLWPSIVESTNARAAEDDGYLTIENPRVIYAGQQLWVEAVHAMADDEMADDEMADDEMADDEMADDGSMSEMDEEKSANLSGAADQIAMAMAHADLLQSALDADNLAEAQAHAEHVINILDGEEGRFFGDGNRDGMVQNPGDGVGVGVYLADALPDVAVSNQPTIETAQQIFAADTADEAAAISTELGAQLMALQDAVAAAMSDSDAMHSGDHEDMDSESEAEMAGDSAEDALAAAEDQRQLAMTHFGFAGDELTSENVAGAQNHIEHVINILDGENGLYFGDNNRDGQTQNPGDGVGVRGHLEQAQAALTAEEAGDDAEAMLAAIASGLEGNEAALEIALQIFSADTASDAASVAEQLESALASIQEAMGETMQ